MALLAALGAGGVGLWRSPLFVQEREIVWRIGALAPSAEQVDLQLWRDSTLLRREQRTFSGAAPREIVHALPLREGRYRARFSVVRRGREAHHGQRALTVEGPGPFVVELDR